MSGQLADEVYHRRVPPGLARDILVVFALHANDDGTEARPSVATVTAKVGCGERTTKRYIKRWRDAKVLVLTARPRPTSGRGALPNVYTVALTNVPLKDGMLVDDQGAKSGDQSATVVRKVRDERPSERPKSSREDKVRAEVARYSREDLEVPPRWRDKFLDEVRGRVVRQLVEDERLYKPWHQKIVREELMKAIREDYYVAELPA